MDRLKCEKKPDKIVSAMIKTTAKTLLIALTIILASNLPVLSHVTIAKAALTIVPDYANSSVNVTSATSSKLYMSYDNKKSWELIETPNIDLLPYLTSKAVTLYFKGNKDVETTLLLPAEDSKALTVSYKVTSGIGSIAWTVNSGAAVQYRNGPNGNWINLTGTSMPTAMYEIKGASLYFRTAPVGTTIRAGKVVSVKVPKRPTAPSIRLDYNKLVLTGVKPNITKYRVGDTTDWKPLSVPDKTNFVDISDVIGGGNIDANIALTGGTVEFRFDGDMKKVNSAAKVIDIPKQDTLADTGITLEGTTLKISDSDTTKIYEYSILPFGSPTGLDNYKAKWIAVPSSHIVTIKTAVKGDTICVRVKSRTDKTTKQVYLPSTYVKKIVA